MQVKHLDLSFGDLHLLKNISFRLNAGDRVCLFGRNGSGKTTLLHALMGQVPEADSNIDLQHQTIAILKQEIPLRDYQLSVEDYLRQELPENYALDYEMEKILARLHFEPPLDTPVEQLSGGEKNKVLLATLLLSDADILLLDEPTNNLDLETTVFLENYLKHCRKSMLIVSHDEDFLAAIVNKVFELENGKITEYMMDYETYLHEKELKYARDLREYQDAVAEKKNLKNRLTQTRHWVRRGASKAPKDNDKLIYRAQMEALKHVEHKGTVIRRKMEKMEIPDFKEREELRFNIATTNQKGPKDIVLDELVCGYPNFQIGPISLTLSFGQKLTILGRNGSGKTTLVKTILGELEPISGRVRIGSGVKFGYMSQNSLDEKHEQTILEMLRQGNHQHDDGHIFAVLKRFYISYDMRNRPYNSLSPGERVKIHLAKLTLEEVNVLVLDEVTNHLDIEATHVIEEIFSAFEGSIINISHNRRFNRILNANTTINLTWYFSNHML